VIREDSLGIERVYLRVKRYAKARARSSYVCSAAMSPGSHRGVSVEWSAGSWEVGSLRL